MYSKNIEVEVIEERKDDGITTLELKEELDDEFVTYKNFENGRLYQDCLNSKVMVQLCDANGKIFVGNVQMVVGYCGENVVITGDLVEVIE